jgi:hypothetical protein
MSETLTKIVVNCSTGEESVVELTAEEIAERETASSDFEAARLAKEEADAAKEALRQSAKAKLIAGEPLTEEEANILTGL